MAATAAQISEIRLISGDDISGQEIVSDDIISQWYDEDGSICAVAYRVARARLAKASKSVGQSGEAQSTNPKVAQIQQLMAALREDCVGALPAATAGYLNLGIDEETNTVDIE